MIWHLSQALTSIPTAQYFKSALAFDTTHFDTRLLIVGLNKLVVIMDRYMVRRLATFFHFK